MKESDEKGKGLEVIKVPKEAPVISIGSGAPGKNPRLVEIYEAAASAINLDASPFPGRWSYLYRTISPSPGTRLIYEEREGQVLEPSNLEDLTQKIVAWMRLQGIPEWLLTCDQAEKVAKMWRAISEPIPEAEVRAVRWLDEPGYTYRRLPWRQEVGPTPAWDGLLSRMSNAEAFMDWLGSLFSDDSSLQNYAWVHGLGNDGKGAIERYLHRLFGKAFVSKQPPPMNSHDKFWAYGLIGARLVVFPDCNERGFVAGGFFKSLTGGDPISVEAKNAMSFTTMLRCKYLFFSNEHPTLSSERADMRRIIFCSFDTPGTYEAGFEDRLWDEGGYFISKCCNGYITRYPNHGPINGDKTEIEVWVSSLEEEFASFFEDNFELVHEEYRKNSDLDEVPSDMRLYLSVLPKDMNDRLINKFKARKDQLGFRSWLHRTHGVRKKSVRVGDGPMDLYPGIRLKNKQTWLYSHDS